MAKQHLLIVDSDPKSLRVLEVSLKKAGFSVTRAVNGLDAIEKIQISVPDLIISDTTMPEMDGFELNTKLRENPEWADIPVIFLTAQKSIEDKIRGLEQGVEDYLTKPIFIREILARVSLVLQRQQRERLENRGSKTKFSGNLNDMGVVDLIQTIDISRKSGVIYLEKKDDKGEIFFRDGKVIDARTARRSRENAVYRMLVWSDGEFEIEFSNIDNEDMITLSTQGLLMEGMRRLDEWGRLQEQLPALSSVFDVDDEILAERLSEIPDEINSVLKKINGQRSLMDVVDQCGFGDIEALTVISKLFFEGLICKVDELSLRKQLLSPPEEKIDNLNDHYYDELEFPSEEESGLRELPEKTKLGIVQALTPVDEVEEEISSTLKLPRINALFSGNTDKQTIKAGGFVAALSQAPPAVTDPSIVNISKKPSEKPPVFSGFTPEISGSKNIKTFNPEPIDQDVGSRALVSRGSQTSILVDESNVPTIIPPSPQIIDQPKEIVFSERATSPGAAVTDVAAKEEDQDDADNTELEIVPSHKIMSPPPKNEPEDTEPHDTEPHDTEPHDTEPHDTETQDNEPLEDHASWELEDRLSAGGAKKIAAIIVAVVLIIGGIVGWQQWGDGVKDFDSAPDLQKFTDIDNKQSNSTVTAFNTKNSTVTQSPIKIDTQREQDQPPKEQDQPVEEKPSSESANLSEVAVVPSLPSEDKIAEYENIMKKALKLSRKKKIELLKKAIEIIPLEDAALAELSLELMEYKKTRKEAESLAKRAVKINSNNGKAWLALGYIHQLNGEGEKSRKAYIKCSQCSGPSMFVRDCKRMIR